MKMRIQRFNLIEILLAIALIAFGVVVILGMLPSGVRATADAATQGYSGEIADQMTEFIYKHGKEIVGSFPSSLESFSDNHDQTIMQTYGNLLLHNNKDGAELPSGYAATGTNGVYRYNAVPGTFVLVMGDSFDNNAETRVDFSALIRVWFSLRSVESFSLDHKINGDHDCHKEGCFNGLEASSGTHTIYEMPSGLQYNIEISWPLSKTYEQRNKAYYSIDGND